MEAELRDLLERGDVPALLDSLEITAIFFGHASAERDYEEAGRLQAGCEFLKQRILELLMASKPLPDGETMAE